MEYLLPYLETILTFWNGVDLQTRIYLWYLLGVFLVLLFLYFWYLFFRRLCGDRKFRGTWYNPDQFEELILILQEDQNSGRRVMRWDEIELLRETRLGRNSGLGFDRARKGYW